VLCFKKVTVYTFLDFPPQAQKFLGVFLLFQNGASYTHFFRISKRCQLYTFLEFNFFQKNEKKKPSMIGVVPSAVCNGFDPAAGGIFPQNKICSIPQ
jgi:hypothetical protein